ncbi:hypothetical protein EGW48_11995 [Enterococcus faecium]|nr:hypothetical protein EGW42_11845 [Enterococcus faecium]ROX98784.1 hypothetical protein EGW48_11995 [Enterococcus faecium]ROZ26216.1 hypothetical protein EGX18_11295 [Enterococcus faecium]
MDKLLREYSKVFSHFFVFLDRTLSLLASLSRWYNNEKVILLPVVLVNFNILKNISKFLQNVVVLDLIEHCKPVICFQIYSLAL